MKGDRGFLGLKGDDGYCPPANITASFKGSKGDKGHKGESGPQGIDGKCPNLLIIYIFGRTNHFNIFQSYSKKHVLAAKIIFFLAANFPFFFLFILWKNAMIFSNWYFI